MEILCKFGAKESETSSLPSNEYQWACKELKSAGNFFAKKLPLSPLQEIHINLWLADFPAGNRQAKAYIEVFGEGAGEKPFFKKGLPRLLL